MSKIKRKTVTCTIDVIMCVACLPGFRNNLKHAPTCDLQAVYFWTTFLPIRCNLFINFYVQYKSLHDSTCDPRWRPYDWCVNVVLQRFFTVTFLSSACDWSYCDLINSEFKVLQSDVKYLTEIVNILNNELKTICQKMAISGLGFQSTQRSRRFSLR